MVEIVVNIIAPIVLLAALGAVMRWKFSVDLTTLSKLNIYLFIPAFIFYSVATSRLGGTQMLGVVILCTLQVITAWAAMELIGRLLRIRREVLTVVTLSVIFYNCGNYGLPLAKLAFPGQDAAAVQAFVILTINLLIFTLGMVIAASAAKTSVAQSILAAVRLPIIPAMAAGLLARWLTGGDAGQLPVLIGVPARYLSDGLVPVALITLGAQLASNPRWPRWKPVSLVMGLRLIAAPIHTAALLWLLHRSGWPPVMLPADVAKMLVLTTATPAAVNVLLLTLELGGDTDLAAECVFWSTVVSCVTIAGWLVVIRAY
jgi:predicted permease